MEFISRHTFESFGAVERKKSLDRLCRGTQNFRRKVYQPNREKYELAARTPQEPDTLFITCADSRIDPELITESGPGQIFVARNVGNLVPPYGPFVGGVSSVIEYAVKALKVDQIVICGHEDCGAMKGLMNPQTTEDMKSVRTWLENAQAALSIVNAKQAMHTLLNPLNSLIEENVLLQLSHLRTHPAVASALAQNKIDIYGWVYSISTGEVRMHNATTGRFESVNPLEVQA